MTGWAVDSPSMSKGAASFPSAERRGVWQVSTCSALVCLLWPAADMVGEKAPPGSRLRQAGQDAGFGPDPRAIASPRPGLLHGLPRRCVGGRSHRQLRSPPVSKATGRQIATAGLPAASIRSVATAGLRRSLLGHHRMDRRQLSGSWALPVRPRDPNGDGPAGRLSESRAPRCPTWIIVLPGDDIVAA
jgi:hypothetical protein